MSIKDSVKSLYGLGSFKMYPPPAQGDTFASGGQIKRDCYIALVPIWRGCREATGEESKNFHPLDPPTSGGHEI